MIYLISGDFNDLNYSEIGFIHFGRCFEIDINIKNTKQDIYKLNLIYTKSSMVFSWRVACLGATTSPLASRGTLDSTRAVGSTWKTPARAYGPGKTINILAASSRRRQLLVDVPLPECR